MSRSGGRPSHEPAAPKEPALGLPSLTEEQIALHRVATLVAQGAAPGAVFTAVADEAGQLVAADIATIDRFDPDDTVTVLAVLGAGNGGPAIGTRTPTAETGNAARVRATGRPARIDRYDEHISPIGYRSGFRAAVSVPIAVGGRPWGAMTVASRSEGKPFPRGTEARLAHFAHLVAIAVANAQARAELEAVVDEQAALRRVATLVAEAAPSEDVYAAVAEEIARLQEADVVALLRYDTDGMATVVGGWGTDGIEVPLGDRMLVAGQGVAVAVLRSQRPAHVNQLEGPPGSVAAWLSWLGVRSAIGGPIVVQDELWGVAVVASRRPGVLPPGSEAQTGEFTELVATAIANAEARAALQHVANEQASLRRVATLVAKAALPEDVFAAVAEEVGRLMPAADVAFVGRYEADDMIEFLGGWSRDRAASFVGDRIPVGETLMSTLVRESGEPARVEDVRETPPAGYDGRWARCRVGVPIRLEDRLWGVMGVGTTRPAGLPAGIEHDLAKFTELVATAIGNADAQAELIASRARIVASGDEARSRLVRDLHDGVQQRLVHAIITLKLARRAHDASDNEAAGGLLGEALAHTEQANAELRGLVHGILPSVLRRGGLAAAVAELTAQLRIPVDVDVTSDRFKNGIEATAYFVIAEALTNVVKHSRARSAKVWVQIVDRSLMLGVQDDGSGGAHPDGSGLRGVADRVIALGGTLRIDSPERRGTRLSATLPLED